jgi:hypothetical protein
MTLAPGRFAGSGTLQSLTGSSPAPITVEFSFDIIAIPTEPLQGGSERQQTVQVLLKIPLSVAALALQPRWESRQDFSLYGQACAANFLGALGERGPQYRLHAYVVRSPSEILR